MFVEWGNCVDPNTGIATLRCLPVVFQNIITAALIFAGLVALIFIIMSGYKFMTSNADPKKIEDARKTFIYSVLGLVLVLISFAIVRVVSNVTGVECINQPGFNQCSENAESVGGMGGYNTPIHDPILEGGNNLKSKDGKNTKKNKKSNKNKKKDTRKKRKKNTKK